LEDTRVNKLSEEAKLRLKLRRDNTRFFLTLWLEREKRLAALKGKTKADEDHRA
jgi:hypothetical protein